jgi:DNA-directed RNA polymerase specialized sigma24 family protein
MRNASADAINWETVAWNDIIPRLLLFARRRRDRFAAGVHLPSEEDLVSGAIEKTIAGTRMWEPERVGLLEHLFGVIRSDLFNEVRKARAHISYDVTAEQFASLLSSSEPTPEDVVSNQSVLTAFLTEIHAKDQQVYDWFSLVSLYGLSEVDIQSTLGVSKVDVAKMRRRLRRYIDDFVEEESTNVHEKG